MIDSLVESGAMWHSGAHTQLGVLGAHHQMAIS